MTLPDTSAQRREILIAAGSLAAVGLSGCFGDDAEDDTESPQQPGFEFQEVPDRQAAAYRRWIPASFSEPGFFVRQVDVHTRSETQHRFLNPILSTAEYVGVEVADILECFVVRVKANAISVLLTASSLNRGRVDSELRDMRYRQEETYRGYYLYERTDDRTALLAVSDTEIISAPTAAKADIKELIRVQRGAAPSMYAENQAFKTVADELGAANIGSILGSVRDTAGTEPTPECAGLAYLSADGTAYQVSQYVYGADVSSAIQAGQLAAEQKQRVDDVFRGVTSSVEEERESVSIRTRAQAPVEEYRRVVGTVPRVPLVTFGLEDDGQSVTISHERGEPVPTEQVSLQTDWRDPPDSISIFWTRRLRENFETFEMGDSLRYAKPADSFYELDIRYRDRTTMLSYATSR